MCHPASLEGRTRQVHHTTLTRTINEDNAAQNTAIIHTRSAPALRKERPETLHLRLSQPIQIAYRVPLQLGVVNHNNATASIS